MFVALQLATGLLVLYTYRVKHFCCRAEPGKPHLEQVCADKKCQPEPAHFC